MLKFKLLILILSAFVCTSTVLAQDAPKNTGLVVSPAIIEVVLEKGKVYSREVVVKSTSSEATGFVVSIENLILADFASVSDKEIIPPEWIKSEQQEFILNPGEVRKVSIVFSPSSNTPPGGYYGIMYIQPVADFSTFTGEKTSAVPKVGVLLLAKVKGRSVENLVFTGFKNKPISTDREVITLGFENLGNVHSMPSGEVVVKNFITRKVKKLPLNPSIVFPNTSKEINIKMEDKLATGVYTLTYSSNVVTKSMTVLFLEPVMTLVISALTLTMILPTIYVKNYFMSKRRNRKLN